MHVGNIICRGYEFIKTFPTYGEKFFRRLAKYFSDVWREIFPTFGGNEKDDRNAIVLSNGRGTKARTQKNGFGDRYVTITSYP